MKYTDVAFLKGLEKNAFTIMLETGEVKQGAYTQKRPYRLDEEYIITVFNLSSGIFSSCQHARHAIHYISDFRVSPATKKAHISKSSNTIYHIDAYNSCLESVFRDVLILINEVFMLGNQPSHCTEEIVLRSNTISETRVGELVAELKKLLDSNACESEAICTLAKVEPSKTSARLGFSINGPYIRRKKVSMEKTNKLLNSIVLEIFDELDREFNKRYTMIKDISR